jgi:hypothetical protein
MYLYVRLILYFLLWLLFTVLLVRLCEVMLLLSIRGFSIVFGDCCYICKSSMLALTPLNPPAITRFAILKGLLS